MRQDMGQVTHIQLTVEAFGLGRIAALFLLVGESELQLVDGLEGGAVLLLTLVLLEQDLPEFPVGLLGDLVQAKVCSRM